MRVFFKAIVATALLAAPLYANAIPMTWNYAGVCTSGDCSVVPSITGTLTGDPTRFGSNNELNEYLFFAGDLNSFSFNVGGYVFSGSHGDGSYQLDAAGNIVGGTMTFGGLFAVDYLNVGSATWRVVDRECKLVIFCHTEVDARGSGSYTTARAVPEPGTLSLIGLGLLSFGLARRRRRA